MFGYSPAGGGALLETIIHIIEMCRYYGIGGAGIMTISERIFERIADLKMAQKEFSEATGIIPSTISEWKSKGTNPASDRIMIICKVLEVSPEWLLSGVDKAGKKANDLDYYVIDKNSELGILIRKYNQFDSKTRARLQGYMEGMNQSDA